jgi:hypothetical protein
MEIHGVLGMAGCMKLFLKDLLSGQWFDSSQSCKDNPFLWLSGTCMSPHSLPQIGQWYPGCDEHNEIWLYIISITLHT